MGKTAASATASDDSVEPLLDSAYQSSRRKTCSAFYGVSPVIQLEKRHHDSLPVKLDR